MLKGTVAVKRIPKSGTVVLTWRPGRKAVSRLFAGTDVLKVRVGRDRRHLGSALSASVRLLAPRLTAHAAKKH